ncbi:outer membrane protein [Phyllobacterium sp. TAF24]|uniref:outer membrane protein n=1 Tax=Phyllobacterium sp. TAF24 TaxID=3233068 RepID=UPI003F98B48D
MKYVFFFAIFLLTPAAALAADALPSTPKPPVAAHNWSGFYAGIMGGYAKEDSKNAPRVDGGFGGGVLGYNWQIPNSPVVLGVDVYAGVADAKASVEFFGITMASKLNALGSVTGRVGIAVDPALFYLKGGYALAHNRLSVSGFDLKVTESHWHTGWTAGGGLEYMVTPKLSANVEYMYINLGSEKYFDVDGGKLPLRTVRAGLSYHLN